MWVQAKCEIILSAYRIRAAWKFFPRHMFKLQKIELSLSSQQSEAAKPRRGRRSATGPEAAPFRFALPKHRYRPTAVRWTSELRCLLRNVSNIGHSKCRISILTSSCTPLCSSVRLASCPWKRARVPGQHYDEIHQPIPQRRYPGG